MSGLPLRSNNPVLDRAEIDRAPEVVRSFSRNGFAQVTAIADTTRLKRR
jgi:hypothetical protein